MLKIVIRNDIGGATVKSTSLPYTPNRGSPPAHSYLIACSWKARPESAGISLHGLPDQDVLK